MPEVRRKYDPTFREGAAWLVTESFDDSGGTPGTDGSPLVWEDLVEAG